MKRFAPFALLLLLATLAWAIEPAIPAAANAPAPAATAPDTKPAPKPEPINTHLALRTVEYTTFIRDPQAKDEVAFIGFDGIGSFFGTSTLTWDVTPAELRVYDTGAKVKWVPVALYFTPIKLTGTQTLTTGTGDKKAETPFTYTKFALYGTYAANADHILDWHSKPFILDNKRVGGGFYWAEAPRQTTTKLGDKKTAIMARTHGIEITRTIGTADEVLYISYTRGLEK
jgi:hypothetical protein